MKSELRIMGSIEFDAGGHIVPIRGVKPRQLLAALALNPNTIVPFGRLIDALWPQNPPRSVLENLRTYATALRRTFEAGEADRPRLITSREGYRLVVEDRLVDASCFASLLKAARRAFHDREVASGAAHLTAALALWRGRAGEGLPRDSWLGNALSALDEERLLAHEERADLWLSLGRHVEIVPDLSRLLAEHPLRERLWQQLMLAHYRCGNTGAALGAYSEVRRTLADELGLDPGEPINDLYRAMLRRDASLGYVASQAHGDVTVVNGRVGGTPVPWQGPPPAGRLFGRAPELAQIDRVLEEARQTCAAVAISGPPGIGKSTLAIWAAHLAANRFPDGQLYVDLRSLGQPRDERGLFPIVISLLRSLGIDSKAMADSPEEATALLRSNLADRRLLIVIDNAVCASQVAALLPARRGSAAIITSPRVLAIAGVSHQVIGALGRDDSLRLLSSIAGDDRIRADPGAAAMVAELCGDSPAALQMAALRLACRPEWTITELWQRLKSSASLFGELRGGGKSLRATYATALAELTIVDAGAAQALSRIAEGSPGMVAAQGTGGFLQGLETLADFHLLEAPSPGFFRIPDLVRELARGSADDAKDRLHRDKSEVP